MVKALTEGTNLLKKFFAQLIIHFILTGLSLGTIYKKISMNIPFLLSFVENLCEKTPYENLQKTIFKKILSVSPKFSLSHTHILPSTEMCMSRWSGKDCLCILWMKKDIVFWFLTISLGFLFTADNKWGFGLLFNTI